MGIFDKNIENFKKPKTELGNFGTKEMRDLSHAIEILRTLRADIFTSTDGSEVGRDKLVKATTYLEDLQKKLIADDATVDQK